jgi:hypothetical protein
VAENESGTTFYVDFERIRKHGGYVYHWTMSDYLKPTEQGYFSNQSYYQGDCNLFKLRTLTEYYYMDQMSRGTQMVWNLTKHQKGWRYPPPNSSGEYILKSVCKYAK